MPRVTFVKSARKDNPVAKKGESYYWWAFMQGGRGGPKRFSKDRPKQSQLTQSEFWGAIYSLQEQHEYAPSYDDIESAIEEIKSELENIKDETQGKYDNMPQGLQDGDSGQLLQERADTLESVISDLDGVDTSFEEGEREDGVTDEEWDEDIEMRKDERAQEIWSEVTDALGNISCS